MTRAGVPPARENCGNPHLLLVALLLYAALAPRPGYAEIPTHSDYPGFRTGALRFAPRGAIVTTLGIEYAPALTNDLAGVEGDLLRAPTLGLHLGLAENAEFRVFWPAYSWLWVHSQAEPPLLGERLGRLSRGFGDVTVSTLIRLHSEAGSWPAFGLKFAAKLPNSNEKLGIGNNSTDVFASALLAKSLASRLTLYADLGLGILTEPTRAFAQNDVLTYGLLWDYWAGGSVHLVGEIAGRETTHRSGPGTASSGDLRTGVALDAGRFGFNLLLVRGLTLSDSRHVGVAANVSGRFGSRRRR